MIRVTEGTGFSLNFNPLFVNRIVVKWASSHFISIFLQIICFSSCFFTDYTISLKFFLVSIS